MCIHKNRRNASSPVDKGYPLLCGCKTKRREHIVSQHRQTYFLGVESHLPRIHLRKVEDIVHELKERRAARADGIERFVHLGLGRYSVPKNLRISENSVERRSDVVADDAEEPVPRLLRRASACKRLLKVCFVLRRLFFLNDKHAEKACPDDTPEHRKRRIRPCDLHSHGSDDGAAERQVSTAERTVRQDRCLPAVVFRRNHGFIFLSCHVRWYCSAFTSSSISSKFFLGGILPYTPLFDKRHFFAKKTEAWRLQSTASCADFFDNG